MQPAQRQPTMADVAERAGVSVSTVSRTMRGLSVVSPHVRAKVEEAARELNFVVSRQASSLVTGKTGVVAVLAPELGTWFMGSVLTSLSAVLREAGLELLVYVASDMKERSDFFKRLPARRNADALLVISFNLTAEESARLDDLGMPIVYVSQSMEGRASVYVDDVAGARRGTQHLLNLGHRRIAFVQSRGPRGFTLSSNERLIGYRQALTDAGLPLDDDLVVATPLGDQRSTAEAVGQLLSLREPPTAVFAEVDQLAMEVIWTLGRSGIDVPGRISVLGFDDHEMASWMDLSTIAQPPGEMGRAAGELTRSLISDSDADRERHIVLPTRLVPRGSTTPLQRKTRSADADGDTVDVNPA